MIKLLFLVLMISVTSCKEGNHETFTLESSLLSIGEDGTIATKFLPYPYGKYYYASGISRLDHGDYKNILDYVSNILSTTAEDVFAVATFFGTKDNIYDIDKISIRDADVLGVYHIINGTPHLSLFSITEEGSSEKLFSFPVKGVMSNSMAYILFNQLDIIGYRSYHLFLDNNVDAAKINWSPVDILSVLTQDKRTKMKNTGWQPEPCVLVVLMGMETIVT